MNEEIPEVEDYEEMELEGIDTRFDGKAGSSILLCCFMLTRLYRDRFA